jgi:hypothetical protein
VSPPSHFDPDLILEIIPTRRMTLSPHHNGNNIPPSETSRPFVTHTGVRNNVVRPCWDVCQSPTVPLESRGPLAMTCHESASDVMSFLLSPSKVRLISRLSLTAEVTPLETLPSASTTHNPCANARNQPQSDS